jgi:hypothetical protein
MPMPLFVSAAMMLETCVPCQELVSEPYFPDLGSKAVQP